MEDDLKALEEKLSQLLRSYYDLRIENVKLKEELHLAKDETEVLKKNMAEASQRIETLMDNLPN
jgi:regulator of replication initiation timing